jgi:hypothetical protein
MVTIKYQVTNSSRCYHAICELVAMGETLLTHNRTGENLADFLTKTTNGAKCRKLVSGVVHDIYDDFPKQEAYKIIRLTHVTRVTLRGLKEYARVEGVSAESWSRR